MTKNNKALRAALVLCVLALFCAAFVGATFAKYVTADAANDSARAAKWGISLSIGGTLFGPEYDVTGAATSGDRIVALGTATATVDSDDDTDVVAPGTKNDVGFTVALNGDPEVDYTVTANYNGVEIKDIYLKAGKWGTMVPAYGLTAENFAENSAVYYASTDGVNFAVAAVEDLADDSKTIYELHDAFTLDADYYPLVWNVDEDGTDAPNVTRTSNLVEIANDIKTNLNAIDGSADDAVNYKYVLTWDWAFEGVNDPADTAIGNLAAANADAIVVFATGTNPYAAATTANYNLTVAFGLDVTVAQVN